MSEKFKLKPFGIVQKEWRLSALDWFTHDVMYDSDVLLVKNALFPYLENIPNGEEILELAAGPSNHLYYPNNYPMKQVTAVDASRLHLWLNISGRKIHADARKPLDLPDSMFGLGLCLFGMRYFENQEEVIKNMLTKIKNGSWLVIIDFVEQCDMRGVRTFEAQNLLAQFPQNKSEFSRLYQSGGYSASMDLLALQKL